MKKLAAILSALALLLSLCACSNQARDAETKGDPPEPGLSSRAVNEGSSQDIESGGDTHTPVTPVAETKAPEPDEESQPSAPEISASTPAPAAPPAHTSTPAPSPEPEPAPEPAPGPEPEPAPEPPPEPAPAPATDPKSTAQSLIGHSVSELYAAIGKPISSDYAPGCLEPDSEDGELTYSGFTVYTVRTATREYVYDVL